MVKHMYLNNTASGRVYEIPERDLVTMGRRKSCDIRYREDKDLALSLSKIHCTFLRYDLERVVDNRQIPLSEVSTKPLSLLSVTDRSKNGTRVNGQPVKANYPLFHGDLLQLGPVEFRVNITD